MLRRVMVIAMLSMLTCLPVHAQYRQWGEGRASAQQSTPAENPGGRSGSQRKGGERKNDDSGRRALSPDEQRELNRDLQRANREIYRKGRDNR